MIRPPPDSIRKSRMGWRKLKKGSSELTAIRVYFSSSAPFQELTNTGDSASACVHLRPRDLNFRCRTMGQVREWLRECDAHGCQPSDTRLPSRLLDVRPFGLSTIVRLVEDPVRPSHHVALSYCWGGPQVTTLTTETMQEYREGIDASCLPKRVRCFESGKWDMCDQISWMPEQRITLM